MSAQDIDDKRNRRERESMQKLIEAAFLRWRQASADDKSALLLSGSALVWAERWLLTFPDEVSIGLKNYILRSLARQSQMLSAEYLVEKQELARRDRTYNRIIMVASALALALVAPKALRDAGLISDDHAPVAVTRPAPSPIGPEPQKQAGGEGEARPPILRLPASRDRADVGSGGDIEQRLPLTTDQIATLAKAEVVKGNKRVSHLLAFEYLGAVVTEMKRGPTPVSWGKREMPVEASSLSGRISGIVGALASGHTLEAADRDLIAQRYPVRSCDENGRLVALTESGEIAVWSSGDGRIELRQKKAGTILESSIDRRCRFAAFGSDDYDVIVRPLSSDGEPRILGRHEAALSWFSFDDDARRLAAVSHDARLKVWDIARKSVVMDYSGVENTILGALMSPDGQSVAVWLDDNSARFLDVASGKEKARFDGHSARIDRMIYSADGTRILASSSDGKISVFDASSFQATAVIQLTNSSVAHARFSSDGNRVVLATDEGGLHVWDAGKNAEVQAIAIPQTTFVDASLNHDGTLLAATTLEGGVSVWHVAGGAQLLDLRAEGAAVAAMNFSRDSLDLQVIAFDGHVTTWPMMVEPAAALSIVKRHAQSCLAPQEREALGLEPMQPAWCASLADARR